MVGLTKKAKKRLPARAGRLSQRKGKQYQKEIAERIASALGLPAEEFYSAMAGTTGVDISASRAAVGDFPFAVETKNCRHVSMPQWLAEAEANADGAGLPFLLVFKLHGRRRNYITMDLEEFLRWW